MLGASATFILASGAATFSPAWCSARGDFAGAWASFVAGSSLAR
jgi:hypothetical protein